MNFRAADARGLSRMNYQSSPTWRSTVAWSQ